MDDLTEMIEREEAAAEEDEDEAGTESEDETEAATEETEAHAEKVAQAEAAIDAAELEKQLKREDTRHENALTKLHGDRFAEMAFCPLCLGQGFLEAMPAGAMPDEVWEAVKALAGHLDSGELQHPPELEPCDRCGGIGEVETGAKNEHNWKIPCAKCDGRGYFNTDDPVHRGRLGLPPPQVAAPYVPQFAPLPVAVGVPNGAPAGPPDTWQGPHSPGNDSYGRWPGHPRFGIDPANGGW